MTDPTRPFRLVMTGAHDLTVYEVEGPLKSPCDLSYEPYPETFVDMLNDAYETGFWRGFDVRGSPEEYDAWVKAGGRP